LQHRSELKKLLNQIKSTEAYQTYTSLEKYSINEEKKFLVSIIEETLNDNEVLNSFYDELNFNWTKELEFVNLMVVKTIKACKETESLNILPIYKDEDDKEFVSTLFRKSVVKSDEYDQLIRDKAKNWEFERIALIDIIMMKMALTEFIEFDSIPVKVSLNEYIELSKAFSTPKSKTFINGILDRIMVELKSDGKVIKRGRGLLE
jgi:N utilization substance protein B